MSNAKRCPKCSDIELTSESFGGVVVNRCPSCAGVLLDSGEMHALLRARLGREVDPGTFASLADPVMDGAPATCFDCDRPMEPMTAPNDMHLDVCQGCKAIFLDEGELARLQDEH